MKTLGNACKRNWHFMLAGGIFVFEAVILLLLREKIYVGICDNLDLFITQLKMLRDNSAFFVHNQAMPVLGSIDRNYFPSEFSLYNLLYLILPDIYAYIAGYLLKLVIAFFSSLLLARHVLREFYGKYEKIVVLVAVAFALLPVYPMYAICFSSMPLILYLLIRIYEKPEWQLFLMVFLYPFLSYFTFFGAFILGYLLIAIVILWIKDRKPSFSLAGALLCLMAGYVCFEYRLFGIMLLSDEETIRSTMVVASYGAADLWKCFLMYSYMGFPTRNPFIPILCCQSAGSTLYGIRCSISQAGKQENFMRMHFLSPLRLLCSTVRSMHSISGSRSGVWWRRFCRR